MSSEWKLLRLGDHCIKIGSGSTPTGGKDTYLVSGPFTLIRSQNVYNEGFTPNGLAFIGDDQARKLIGVSVEKNDVLLNITGDSVASVCLAPAKYLPARVNQHVAIIRPKSNSFDSRFLRYFLASPQQQELMFGLASAGATRPALTKVMIENFKISCPSIEIQRVIADTLSSIDDRIALLRETNATLEAIAQALFKSWFVDFDPARAKQQGQIPEGMDEATAALFPDSFEESELGLVPKGWQLGTLSDIAKTAKTQLQPSELNSDMNYVGLEHIPRKALSLDAWDDASGLESAKAAFNKGDILFGKLRPYFHKVVIAPFAGVCSTDILVCQSTSTDYYGMAVLHLFSETLISYADRLSNGAKMPRITWKDLAAYPIVIPASPVAKSFSNVVQPLFNRMLANVGHIQTLASIRDTLLPRLISGQLRITEPEDAVEEAAA